VSCNRRLLCVCLLVTSLGLGSNAEAKVARYGYAISGFSVMPYAIDSKTGRLRFTAEQDLSAPPCSGYNQATVAPSQNFLYIPASCGQMLAASIGANGVLTPITGSPFTIGANPYSFVVTPSGRFGYAADISAYPAVSIIPVGINTTSGALTQLSGSVSYSATQIPTTLMDPLGKFLYVLDTNNGIYVYKINATSGALTEVAGSPFATGGQAVSLAAYPGGKFLVVTNYNDRNMAVLILNRTTGVLAFASGSPFTTSGYPNSLAIDPVGAHFVFVGYGSGDANVSVFRLNTTTGVLAEVSGSPFATYGSYGSDFLTVNPSGHYLYTRTEGGGGSNWQLQMLRIDATTGALTPAQTISNPWASGLTITTGTTPVTFAPTYLYAANSPFAPGSSQDEIAEYSVSSTGSLTSVGSISDTLAPQQLALAPSGQNLRSIDSSYVNDYTIQSGGALNLLTNTTEYGSLILEDPNGAYLYLANGSSVADFTIDPATQEIGGFGTYPFGGNVVSMATSFGAYGDFVLTADDTLWQIYRGSNTGATTGSFTVGNSPSAVAMDGAGRFAYVANGADNTLSGFANYGGGFTQINGGTPFETGTGPSAIAGDPFGDFLYVANSASHDLWAYSIDPVTGNLTEIGSPLAVGNGPVALNVDYSGKFLYCANSLDGTISVFKINSNGTLKSSGKVTVDATQPTTPAPTSIVSTGTYQ
jgi:6-phosphogluconolactonase